jgi:ATP-dependent DNA helicase RecG
MKRCSSSARTAVAAGNQEANEITLRTLTVMRCFALSGSSSRLEGWAGPMGKSLPDVLDRLGLQKDGKLLRADVVLFGKIFLPDYHSASCAWRGFAAWTRPSSSTSDSFAGQHASFEETEISVNGTSLCPRKSSRPDAPGGDAAHPTRRDARDPRQCPHPPRLHHRWRRSLAIFDGRVEVWSAGKYPKRDHAELLTRDHPSILRVPGSRPGRSLAAVGQRNLWRPARRREVETKHRPSNARRATGRRRSAGPAFGRIYRL